MVSLSTGTLPENFPTLARSEQLYSDQSPLFAGPVVRALIYVKPGI